MNWSLASSLCTSVGMWAYALLAKIGFFAGLGIDRSDSESSEVQWRAKKSDRLRTEEEHGVASRGIYSGEPQTISSLHSLTQRRVSHYKPTRCFAAKSHLVKRSASCTGKWSEFNGRCFHYVPRPMTWAKAEKNCQSMGGNLASIHNILEYHEIQRLVMSSSYEYKEAWIGGSDAQEENTWFWSDGKPFHYSNWCSGEPNNHRRGQHCIQINHAGKQHY
ncbi:hypothetical protein L3Q82_016501 [Scortum barcoo]|uniref:Uncharacterized protein n=1 Tax=Scortum barcoo TaxID=214431 RepID=A0ACB8X7E9_9TELE|nr:hypothetical protein L3Q82_016501 [Scortum barcoo]